MEDIAVTTFEAKCASCGHMFFTPILSDFSYGQSLFCSEDGKHYAHANAFDASAKLIHVLLPDDCGAELFWFALATLADKINGKKLSVSVHCPRCASLKVKRYLGKETGEMPVQKAAYNDFVALPREDIILKVKETVEQFDERKSK